MRNAVVSLPLHAFALQGTAESPDGPTVDHSQRKVAKAKRQRAEGKGQRAKGRGMDGRVLRVTQMWHGRTEALVCFRAGLGFSRCRRHTGALAAQRTACLEREHGVEPVLRAVCIDPAAAIRRCRPTPSTQCLRCGAGVVRCGGPPLPSHTHSHTGKHARARVNTHPDPPVRCECECGAGAVR